MMKMTVGMMEAGMILHVSRLLRLGTFVCVMSFIAAIITYHLTDTFGIFGCTGSGLALCLGLGLGLAKISA